VHPKKNSSLSMQLRTKSKRRASTERQVLFFTSEVSTSTSVIFSIESSFSLPITILQSEGSVQALKASSSFSLSWKSTLSSFTLRLIISEIGSDVNLDITQTILNNLSFPDSKRVLM